MANANRMTGTPQLRLDTDTRLEWGHRVFDPDGKPVQLPAKAIITLRHLGVLIRNRELGGLQISESIHLLLTPEYDPITDGLRRVLGTSLEGPKLLVCHCRRCKRNRGTAMQDLKEQLFDFSNDMQEQRSAE